MQTNVDLRPLNTLALPATAKAFARFSSQIELASVLERAKANNVKVYVLGEGSNVLLANDVDGLILQSAMQDIRLLEQDKDNAYVAVDAGVNWHQWVVKSISFGHGLENLALIPGSVGAAPIQNIGAYGVEVDEFIHQVEGIEISTGTAKIIAADACDFAYRDSVFKHQLKNNFIITRVVFRLPKKFQPNLSYAPLRQLSAINPEGLIKTVCDIRRSKLPNPVEIPNAGSFFKNPMISHAQAAELTKRFPELPQYPQANNQVKLAAGWLIEQAGWKGRWLGNVRMHDKQALVLTANGQASYAEVMRLKEAVVESVQRLFEVTLEAEPQEFP